MRIGFNPNKDQELINNDFFHQVIVPVYISNDNEYFEESFQIFKYCIESLLKTCHKNTFLTIINNGSSLQVENYLNELFVNKKIHEIIQTTNIGKLNAILKGISGHKFDLITITDSDVMFLNNWQSETYKIFSNYPKTGAVCPTPSSRSLRTYTSNIYWDLFFSKKLKWNKIENPNGLLKFAESIGNPNFYNESQLKNTFTIDNLKTKAVIGAGHFVTTYRADIIENFKCSYTKFKLGGNSEQYFLDFPVILKGFWRLSTFENFAYHLGNKLENWMPLQFLEIESNNKNPQFKLENIKVDSKFFYYLKNTLFSKLILNKKIFKYFLIWKGLSKSEVNNYLN